MQGHDGLHVNSWICTRDRRPESGSTEGCVRLALKYSTGKNIELRFGSELTIFRALQLQNAGITIDPLTLEILNYLLSVESFPSPYPVSPVSTDSCPFSYLCIEIREGANRICLSQVFKSEYDSHLYFRVHPKSVFCALDNHSSPV